MAAAGGTRGEAAEEAPPAAKRAAGQRRLLVVLEGASLETVKVRVGAVPRPAAPAVPGARPCELCPPSRRWGRRSSCSTATSTRRCC